MKANFRKLFEDLSKYLSNSLIPAWKLLQKQKFVLSNQILDTTFKVAMY